MMTFGGRWLNGTSEEAETTCANDFDLTGSDEERNDQLQMIGAIV